jgi:UTP--glucose-1-phosphate uridylyltransferase
MPKEMLPVVDKPAIQYVVEEAVAAGIRDVLIIVGRNKNSIANHFDSVPELESALTTKGDTAKLGTVSHSSQLADIHITRQGEPRGLGHAVSRAASYVGPSSFVVMLGDDLIDERDPLLPTMLAVHERTGGAVIALMEVDPAQVHLYGVATVGEQAADGSVRVLDLVEKPSRGEAPSNLAVIGRYVLAPGVYGVVFSGRRYDTGDRVDYIKAVLQLAVERDDLGAELRPWIKQFAARLEVTGASAAQPAVEMGAAR